MVPSVASSPASVHVVVPGHLETRTGGYEYDRRIVQGLRGLGWTVQVHEVDGAFPFPASADRERFAAALARIPDATRTVVDGLAFGMAPDEVGREAARLRLVALVHHPLAEERGVNPSEAAMLQANERRALESARLVIVTSPATARRLEAYGVSRNRSVVVEPGTDRAPIAHGSRDGRVHLLIVASVVPRKGHDVLVDALAAIPDRTWRLTCVGSLDRDPKTADAVRAKVAAAGLDPYVAFVGEGDAASVDGYYDRADVFVLPTFHEGYGMVVAEAIAHGLPVVSTPTGGIAALVGEEAGLLVPAGDVRALTDALSRIVADAALRETLAAGARRARGRLPTWDRASREFAAALDRVGENE
jgi:glycosyltransferase involved in cell wall biosynthesis